MEDIREIIDRIYPGARERYEAMSEDERERNEVEIYCDILNEDCPEADHYPVRTEEGWIVRRVDKEM